MKLTLTTQEERDLYSDMQRKLWEHSRYNVRKEYYPLKMGLWEAEKTAIETDYRSKILKIQKEVKAKKTTAAATVEPLRRSRRHATKTTK